MNISSKNLNSLERQMVQVKKKNFLTNQVWLSFDFNEYLVSSVATLRSEPGGSNTIYELSHIFVEEKCARQQKLLILSTWYISKYTVNLARWVRALCYHYSLLVSFFAHDDAKYDNNNNNDAADDKCINIYI